MEIVRCVGKNFLRNLDCNSLQEGIELGGKNHSQALALSLSEKGKSLRRSYSFPESEINPSPIYTGRYDLEI